MMFTTILRMPTGIMIMLTGVVQARTINTYVFATLPSTTTQIMILVDRTTSMLLT